MYNIVWRGDLDTVCRDSGIELALDSYTILDRLSINITRVNTKAFLTFRRLGGAVDVR
jgi:hypothetical protein